MTKVTAGNMSIAQFAETTPDLLIMVVQFAAFLGIFRDPAGLNPWVAGVLASLLVTWVIFVPCCMRSSAHPHLMTRLEAG